MVGGYGPPPFYMTHNSILYGRYPIIICTAIALHFVWATGLLFDPNAVHATAPNAMLVVTGWLSSNDHTLTALVFLMVAISATFALFSTTSWRYVLMLPQHLALWISAIGCLHAMWDGAFADGVARGNWFLIVDQVPVVLIAIAQTFALYIMVLRDRHRDKSDGRKG